MDGRDLDKRRLEKNAAVRCAAEFSCPLEAFPGSRRIPGAVLAHAPRRGDDVLVEWRRDNGVERLIPALNPQRTFPHRLSSPAHNHTAYSAHLAASEQGLRNVLGLN